MTQPHNSAPNRLVPDRFPLKGSRLIEASAGTGKTWTIAALYLRLVLGHGADGTAFARPLGPSEILVMTFTKAATRELSDRIRQRLLQAARCFRGDEIVSANDPFLTALIESYPQGPARNQAAWRLAMAAQSMDEASVHTIDAWCQRMLREHAFDSGSLFHESLVANEAHLLTEATQDYWRHEGYPLAGDRLVQVLKVWKGVDELCKDVAQLMQHGFHTQEGRKTDLLQKSLSHLIDDLMKDIPSTEERVKHVADMQTWIQQELVNRRGHWNGTKLKPDSAGKWFEELSAWAQEKTPLELPDIGKGLTRLTPTGLKDARTNAAPPEFSIPDCFTWFQTIVDWYQQNSTTALIRQHAAVHIAERLSRLKRQSRSFGFADLLERLESALQGPHGERLRQRIRTQYPVALIDEFQDTSPLQYRIFDQIYGTETNSDDVALLLIGDPKQSIYGFRGADIYSYLKARRATAGRHYVLGTNYRSTVPLVQAINHCFMQADQRPDASAFRFATGPDNPLPYSAVDAQGRTERLVMQAQAEDDSLPALTLVHDLEPLNADSIRFRFGERCAEQIVVWLNERSFGFKNKDGTFDRLRPQDIAVLVRTGQEARTVRTALQRRGVASVYLSDKESVYHSDEASDLIHWLRGVAMPQSATLVRAALAVGTMGLTLDELGRVAHDDDTFDTFSVVLTSLQQVWQKQGVLAMLRQTVHHFKLGARWLNQATDGERRLTNFMHLAELLQNASRELEGEQALIRWLEQQIEDSTAAGDEQIMRLESDADLVKVITIHKSKGLEFPVVCLPFPVLFRSVDKRNQRSLSLPDEQGSRRLVLEPETEDMKIAEEERLREDLRLLYVALTRPRHLLWVGFATFRPGNNKDCQNHKSAIGYLLGGDQPLQPTDWQDKLAHLAGACPSIEVQRPSDTTQVTPLAEADNDVPLASAPRFTTQFERDWTIASYSRLSNAIKETGVLAGNLRKTRWQEDEGLAGAVSVTDDEPVLTQAATPARSESAIQHTFARGPTAGSFLHDQLEWLAERGFGIAKEETLRGQLLERLGRSSYNEHATELLEWLQQICTTPLPGPDVALEHLHRPKAEIEFWMPVDDLGIDKLDQICRDHLLPGLDRPALHTSTLRGMLMGFADLVFEHQGRYWVLDYKSNFLGAADQAYDDRTTADAMAQHRYDVQAAIYLTALHRLLASRLGQAYAPKQHLGGAIFLFLRGIHHPGRGACVLQPEENFYSEMDALLREKDTCA